MQQKTHDEKKVELSLTHEREETSRFVVALAQAEEDLNKEAHQWEEEKSSLQQLIEEQQQALQQETTRDHLRDKIVDLEQKMFSVEKIPKSLQTY